MRCECTDQCCPCNGTCHQRAVAILYRCDMEDKTGTAMCSECTNDALDSGLFEIEYLDGDN